MSASPLLGPLRGPTSIFRPGARSRSFKQYICSFAYLLIFISFLILCKDAFFRTSSRQAVAPAVATSRHPHWKSFSSIDTLVAFGDSWSSFGFAPCWLYNISEAPFHSPLFPGITSTLGPNWIGFLTNVYNQSVMKTYDYALGGAMTYHTPLPVDLLLWDVALEVNEFTGKDRCEYSPDSFDPDTTLFSFFLGLNDVMGCLEVAHCDLENPPRDETITAYIAAVEKIYAAGGRNFLFVNIPPTSGMVLSEDASMVPQERLHMKLIKEYNFEFKKLWDQFGTRHPDAAIFQFDAWNLMKQVHKNPAAFPETAIIKDTTGDCRTVYAIAKWQYGQEATQAELDRCHGLQPYEYLWVGPGHTTWPFHKALARQVVELLEAGPSEGIRLSNMG